MSAPIDQAPDDTEIAAEYVLRVLSPDAHRAAAVRAASDPTFAAEVRRWEDRFAPMMEEVDPVTPDPAIRGALMDRLFGSPSHETSGTRTGVWQVLAAIGFAAAAAFAVIAFSPQFGQSTGPVAEAPAPRFVAELAVADESTRMFAVIDPVTAELDLAWTARDQPDGRDLQLWGLVEGQDPISIGVLPPGRQATLSVPRELLNAPDGLQLAISEEPLGGSPTGLPTGEVLAVSAVSAI
ncbi:MAG: anti-sigma factor [Pseudomonadota bacterium]